MPLQIILVVVIGCLNSIAHGASNPLRFRQLTFRSLRAAKLTTLKALLAQTPQSLRAYKIDGERLEEIEIQLAEKGLKLGEPYDGPDFAVERLLFPKHGPRLPVRVVHQTQYQLGPVNLSTRTYNTLRGAGIVSLKALLEQSYPKLFAVHGFAERCAFEVAEKLAERGLRLQDSYIGRDVFLTAEPRTPQRPPDQAPFGAFRLTERTYDLLQRHGISTLKRLLDWTPKDLLRLDGFEEINLLEIIVRLRERGLMFSDVYTGKEIPIRSKPAPSPLAALKFETETYRILNAYKITTLHLLLKNGLETRRALHPHVRDQIVVSLAERGVRLGEPYSGPDVPILERQKPAEPLPPLKEVHRSQAELGSLRLRRILFESLQDAGITTLRRLTANTQDDLRRVPRLNPKRVQEIVAILAERGLRLGDKFDGLDVPIIWDKSVKRGSAQNLAQDQTELGPLRLSQGMAQALESEGITSIKGLFEQSVQGLLSILLSSELYWRELETALNERGLSLGLPYTGPDIPIEPRKEDPDTCADMQWGEDRPS